MRKLNWSCGIVFLLCTAAAVSCTTAPSETHVEPSVVPVVQTAPEEPAVIEETKPTAEEQTIVTPPAEPIAETVEKPIETVPFNPESISVELKSTTFFDVKALINKLNKIIQAKDFEAWSAELTQGYRDYYSSADTLAEISEYAVLKRQKIVLKSLKDYFTHVVYPSRQNDRVDDIEFIDEFKIRAIIVNIKGERLVLYNLEKIDDTWKIAIWR